MKKALSIILSLGLLAGSAIPAFAASNEATQAANTLYSLGLFKGTWTNDDGTPVFDLDRAPTRSEAITMLVRLLGKETEALSGTWQTPFYDVADWAIPYVGYAYTNGLTTGTGDNTFGGEDIVSASQYLTFVFRALGYNSDTDFQWDKAWELSDTLNITAGQYNAVSDFTRGDVAIISLRALSTAIKGSQITLYSSIAPYDPLQAALDAGAIIIDTTGLDLSDDTPLTPTGQIIESPSTPSSPSTPNGGTGRDLTTDEGIIAAAEQGGEITVDELNQIYGFGGYFIGPDGQSHYSAGGFTDENGNFFVRDSGGYRHYASEFYIAPEGTYVYGTVNVSGRICYNDHWGNITWLVDGTWYG